MSRVSFSQDPTAAALVKSYSDKKRELDTLESNASQEERSGANSGSFDRVVDALSKLDMGSKKFVTTEDELFNEDVIQKLVANVLQTRVTDQLLQRVVDQNKVEIAKNQLIVDESIASEIGLPDKSVRLIEAILPRSNSVGGGGGGGVARETYKNILSRVSQDQTVSQHLGELARATLLRYPEQFADLVLAQEGMSLEREFVNERVNYELVRAINSHIRTLHAQSTSPIRKDELEGYIDPVFEAIEAIDFGLKFSVDDQWSTVFESAKRLIDPNDEFDEDYLNELLNQVGIPLIAKEDRVLTPKEARDSSLYIESAARSGVSGDEIRRVISDSARESISGRGILSTPNGNNVQVISTLTREDRPYATNRLSRKSLEALVSAYDDSLAVSLARRLSHKPDSNTSDLLTKERRIVPDLQVSQTLENLNPTDIESVVYFTDPLLVGAKVLGKVSDQELEDLMVDMSDLSLMASVQVN